VPGKHRTRVLLGLWRRLPVPYRAGRSGRAAPSTGLCRLAGGLAGGAVAVAVVVMVVVTQGATAPPTVSGPSGAPATSGPGASSPVPPAPSTSPSLAAARAHPARSGAPGPAPSTGRGSALAGSAGITPDGLTGTYQLTSVWDTGLVVAFVVSNRSARAQTWAVRLALPPGITIVDTWSVLARRSGDTLVLTPADGAALAPGASWRFGFEGARVPGTPYQPTSCTINYSPCG
jgi:cellulose binding protein with CBM2 domain